VGGSWCPVTFGRTESGDGRTHGLTVIEVVVAVTLLSIVAAAVCAVFAAQRRFYDWQVQVASARDAARVAVEVLSGELRPLSPGAGDLYAVAADSVSLRSITGIGVICGVEAGTVGISLVTGVFTDAATDSALVFVGQRATGTAGWVTARIRKVRSGGAILCPNGEPSDVRLDLDPNPTEADVGSFVRGFRPYTYKLYSASDGRWWLGQRLRAGRIQPITGPFAAPERGGLRIEARDSTGLPARSPNAVVEILISVKVESARRVRVRGGAVVFTDTLSSRVYLRNS
jgi:hypothetical protein